MSEPNFSETLRNLDKEFNTNKDFGFNGIMQGAASLQQQQQVQQQQQLQQAAPAQAAPAAPSEPTPQQLADIMAPLNATLQSNVSRFNNEISSLKQQLAQRPPAADGTIDPVQAQINRLEQEQKDMTLQFVRQQAKAELKVAQQIYPNAGLSEKDIDDVWIPYNLDQRPDYARTIQWDKHFEVYGNAKEKPYWQQKVAALEAQMANRGASDAIANMSGAPRTTGGAGLPSSQIFGNHELSDEDRVYAEASKIMSGDSGLGSKARFLGFGRAIGEAKRRLGFA